MNKLAVAVLLAGLTGGLMAQPSETPVNWKAIEDSWKIVAADFTNTTAIDQFVTMLPSTGKAAGIAGEGAALVSQIGQAIPALDNLIAGTGDQPQMRLCLGLLTLVPAEIEIRLYRILGAAIPFNPKGFLEEVDTQRQRIPDLAALLGSFRYDMPGDDAGQQLEKKLRMNVIDGVEEKPLKSIKSECLKTLKKM